MNRASLRCGLITPSAVNVHLELSISMSNLVVPVLKIVSVSVAIELVVRITK